ncbi:hypothetical protein MTR_4g006330 [Medicago truncatula]|uniref:Uncharacterized protein n=1 Tax=Medicago truncatula TaxID=3880 RepID=G7JD63_MEDTR|nr:hypothetical protein MTR_4g006330 [Medicago truncatula]
MKCTNQYGLHLYPSSTASLIFYTNVVFETCWLRNFFLELNCPIHNVNMVHCNNSSAIYLPNNQI